MRSTRDRFHAAISGAPTTTVAAGVVTAMHLASCREFGQEVEELLAKGGLNTISLKELITYYCS